MARKFTLQSRTAAGDIDFSADLNREQLAVATAPGGPMLVVAGAGSGKTRALTYRLAWLVHHGIDPSRILLVTFTNRAAREMLGRVEVLVKQKTREIWGGTFHHIANRILRIHGKLLGISPDFTILDREDARDLLASCVDEAGIDIRQRRFPQKAVLAAISSFLQNTLESLDEVLSKRYPMFVEEIGGIEKVLVLYTEKKRLRQLLDFDDLLSAWLRLMAEHQDVRDQLAGQFLHILVDEYQDTNKIQGAIIDLLAARHRNLTVVGDDSQSIYSFRGANFENIITFKDRYADAREYKLETNYRSVPEILTLANASIARNVRRLPKNLQAIRSSGLKPAIVPCHDHYTQSRFIAEYVLHLLDEGRTLADIAVLYRSHWHSLEIQLEFQRRNIPFHIRGGLRFFEQAHMKDILCYLRVMQNPTDELAWLRLLKMLPRVGSALSRRVWRHISDSADPVKEVFTVETASLLPASARPFYEDFAALIKDAREIDSPAEIIDLVLKRSYEDYLVSHYDGASLRKEDINGLANFASQYKNVEAFLADVALAGEFSGENVVAGPDEQEFVILSTVHQAKGLEWPIVFIPWLSDGRFPSDMAMNRKEELEEERRVFHVAVTRARDELYLIVPEIYRNRGGNLVMMKPSRFLTELSRELTEQMELEEGLPHLIGGNERNCLPPGEQT
ncbi:MAG: UvrD-helicase domain-containing protein [Sedimentisphaerales bacterium]|jgi:DNA helicase-2/ATP-dependent DNA helicase PcrA|nr:UvrD-helicase domain-containing protein [Sedimentisphaerales bacterium]NLT76454.1 UvrD-helicase domain-containing protein [Planctomycetota bacterium]